MYGSKLLPYIRQRRKRMSFTYMGKSTDTILDASLTLCSFEPLEELAGTTRETIKGEPTLARPVVNEYYTRYSDVLVFEGALIKNDGTAFTEAEQQTVEAWLTSPKRSGWLEFFNEHEDPCALYCGKFIATSWKQSRGGFIGVSFTFETNANYAWKRFRHNFFVRNSQSIQIDVESDEYEEWVYPILRITQPVASSEISIINRNDSNRTLKLWTEYQTSIEMECRNCFVTDDSGEPVEYKKLGWNEAKNIYWPRLQSGLNDLDLIGNMNLTISYLAPFKKVGGWLC